MSDPMRALNPGKVLNKTIAELRRLVDVVRISRSEVEPRPESNSADVEERQRRVSSVLSRPGQQRARRLAFERFGACLISGETVPDALEAAHIHPVYRNGSDDIDNILLLRADLHRLFDAGLLTISKDPKPCVRIARDARRLGSSYVSFSTLSGNVSKLSTAQWMALETRNHQWDDDLGLTHLTRRPAKASLLTPSRL